MSSPFFQLAIRDVHLATTRCFDNSKKFAINEHLLPIRRPFGPFGKCGLLSVRW